VPVKKVWDALCAYCFLPRLRDQVVFVEAIQDGIVSMAVQGVSSEPVSNSPGPRDL
jgi:hypothetical protein